MSQEQLAEILELRSGKQTISNWENGRSEPSLRDLRRLAELFDSSLGWLIDGSGTPNVKDTPPGKVLMDAQEVIKMQGELLKLREERAVKPEQSTDK